MTKEQKDSIEYQAIMYCVQENKSLDDYEAIMKQTNDGIEQMEKDEISKLIVTVRKWMESASPENRLNLLSDIMDGYCNYCGVAKEFWGSPHGCQCENDE